MECFELYLIPVWAICIILLNVNSCWSDLIRIKLYLEFSAKKSKRNLNLIANFSDLRFQVGYTLTKWDPKLVAFVSNALATATCFRVDSVLNWYGRHTIWLAHFFVCFIFWHLVKLMKYFKILISLLENTFTFMYN